MQSRAVRKAAAQSFPAWFLVVPMPHQSQACKLTTVLGVLLQDPQVRLASLKRQLSKQPSLKLASASSNVSALAQQRSNLSVLSQQHFSVSSLGREQPRRRVTDGSVPSVSSSLARTQRPGVTRSASTMTQRSVPAAFAR